MRTIQVESSLPAPADRVWSALQYPGTFVYVARGVLGMPALAGRCEPFTVGETGSGWIFLFHVIPLSRHTIEVVAIDDDTCTIRTREHGGLLKTWNHTLHVEAIDDQTSRYTDTIEIDAGPLTPVVARAALAIFHHRHRRWHRLARRQLGTTTRSVDRAIRR